MALLNSGFEITNPNDFTQNLGRLVNVGFGLDANAPVEEIQVNIEDDEEDKEKEDGDAEKDEAEQSLNPDDVEIEDLSGNDEAEKKNEL